MKKGERYEDPATRSQFVVDHVRNGTVYLVEVGGLLKCPFGVPVHFAARVLRPYRPIVHPPFPIEEAFLYV